MTLIYRKKAKIYFDIHFRKIHNNHPNIDCTQHHRLLACNYTGRYSNHKRCFYFQSDCIYTAYSHDQIRDANSHFDTYHIDVQLHFHGNDTVHDICYRIDSANRMDYNDILEMEKFKKNINLSGWKMSVIELEI